MRVSTLVRDSRPLAVLRRTARSAPTALFEPLEPRLLLSLLGVAVEYPDITYDSNGGVAYHAAAGTLDSSAAPVSFKLQAGARPVRVQDPKDVELHIVLDGSGGVVGGVVGDDLRVEGVITSGGTVYSGVLLTGEILQFGFFDTGTNTDQYDFRFMPTGGSLMPFFAGKDIGVTMTSLNSTFVGDFKWDFSGLAQGLIGPIEPLPPASLAGRVFVDANNNGQPDDSEQGINGVTITLTGTAIGGLLVCRSAVSGTISGVDGSYVFEDLLPGTYTVTESQPEGYLDGKDAVGSLGGTVGADEVGAIALGAGVDGIGYHFGELLPASLSGAVWLDANNNGAIDSGELGISGVAIALTGADDLGAGVSLTGSTAADGSYEFGNLRPGTYTITETQPVGYLDAAGSPATQISGIVLAGGQAAAGNNFGELLPSSLSGFGWLDFNDDGAIDYGERSIQGITTKLTGVDDQGNAIQMTAQTDADGVYAFANLRPGIYAITESQPTGYVNGQSVAGTLGGIEGTDVISGITLAANTDGLNYNFGERPLAGTTVHSGQAATIGFWQNKNGQALINALNGGSSANQLGNWLAETLPNMYGSLTGMTNAQIAQVYTNTFKSNKNISGPAKFDCQVFAVALATYATNSTLAGTAAQRYGFQITQYGLGIATYNVGSSGAAFGVANNTTLTVLDMLLATDARSADGRIYNLNVTLRTLANVIYTGINETGDIG